MPLILPHGLPAAETLRREGAVLPPAAPEGVRPLRVLLLNLMPQKAVTELDFARMLCGCSEWVELIPVKIRGQRYKTTPQAHMDRYYTDIDAFEADGADGLIVTGAPVEHLPFEQVRYWPQLCRIMDWAQRRVRSTLYVCWGAQAALYHRYGIAKHGLPAKMFGIFAQNVLAPEEPLFDGIGSPFAMPNSRHTEVRAAEFPSDAGLRLVAASSESGAGVAVADGGRAIFDVGHLEYAPLTLETEWRRDQAKGLPIEMPRHYYHADSPEAGVDYSWREAALRFYANWITHYVAPGRR